LIDQITRTVAMEVEMQKQMELLAEQRAQLAATQQQ
jgi:hypothetical protein